MSALRQPAAPPPAQGSDLSRATHLWCWGEWGELIKFAQGQLAHSPDRANLSALCALAFGQLGDFEAMEHHLRNARAWRCNQAFLRRVLLSGLENSLGRCAALLGHSRADRYFHASVAAARPEGDVAALVRARGVRERLQLRQTPQVVASLQTELEELEHDGLISARRQRAFGQRLDTIADLCRMPPPDAALTLPAHIRAFIDQGVSDDPDFYERLEQANQDLSLPDKCLMAVAVARAFAAAGMRRRALEMLHRAEADCPDAQGELAALIAKQALALEVPGLAVRALLRAALAPHGVFDATERAALRHSIMAAEPAPLADEQLMRAYLGQWTPPQGRLPVMIELDGNISPHPEQGTTRRRAALCSSFDLHMVTILGSEESCTRAVALFDQLGQAHQAIAQQPEDYLATCEGPFDLVVMPQQDEGQMLALARLMLRALAPGAGVIVPEIWREGAHWRGHGAAAVRFLLAQGFTLAERAERTVLLCKPPAHAS